MSFEFIDSIPPLMVENFYLILENYHVYTVFLETMGKDK